MPACDCPFGPRCESCFNCEEEPQPVMGLRDRRTGCIREKADWSIFVWHERVIKRAGFTDFNRVLFYCNPCLRTLHEVTGRPLRGLDKPEGAEDFWRPSFRDHVKLSAMEMRRQAAR